MWTGVTGEVSKATLTASQDKKVCVWKQDLMILMTLLRSVGPGAIFITEPQVLHKAGWNQPHIQQQHSNIQAHI